MNPSYRSQCESFAAQANGRISVLASSSVEALLASFHLSLYWFARGRINRARSIASKRDRFLLIKKDTPTIRGHAVNCLMIRIRLPVLPGPDSARPY